MVDFPSLSATHRVLAAQVQDLKAENKVLRSKLPKRVTVTDAERARLVKLGTKVGSAIRGADHHRVTAHLHAAGHFVVLGEKHLNDVAEQYIAHYNTKRTHSAIGRAPCGADPPVEPIGRIGCHERLGGLHYYRKAEKMTADGTVLCVGLSGYGAGGVTVSSASECLYRA